MRHTIFLHADSLLDFKKIYEAVLQFKRQEMKMSLSNLLFKLLHKFGEEIFVYIIFIL